MKIYKIITINLLVFLLLLLFLELLSRVFLAIYIGNSTAGLSERNANLIYEPYVMYGPNWNKIIDNQSINNNEFRILILGGSTAQALPSTLIKKKLINKINKKILIFNLAFGGYVAQQELVTLVTYVNKIKPNLIINIDGANDIIHSLKQENYGEFLLNNIYKIYLTKPYFAPFIWLIQNSQLYSSIVIFLERKQPDSFNSKNDFLNYYVDTIKKIKEISEIYSFQFIQVLQPHVFFKKNKSIEEKSFTRYNYRNNFIKTSYSYIFKKLEVLFYESNSVFIDGRTPYIDINKRIFSDDVHFFDETGYEILIDTIVKEVN